MERKTWIIIGVVIVVALVVLVAIIGGVSATAGKATAAFKPAGKVPSPDATPLPSRPPNALDGYVFVPKMDSNGDDVEERPDLVGLPLLMAEECNSTPGCKGFNTNGTIKGAIKPKAEWTHWTSDANKGLYYRKGLQV